jgi:hypothetical protein
MRSMVEGSNGAFGPTTVWLRQPVPLPVPGRS